MGILSPMSEDASAGGVVWARHIDRSASTQRWRKFGLWILLPTVVGLVLALLFGGMGAFLGVLILLGGIGGLMALLLWLYNLSLRQNPEIRLVEGQLVQGRTTVTLAAVESWTTHRRTGPTGNVGGPVAQVIFRIPVHRDGVRGVRLDGGPAFDTVHFGWGEMPEDELAGVRRALEPHIAAPWVAMERLRD